MIYDPIVKNWVQGTEIPVNRRRGASGAVHYDGKFYTVGGNTNGHSGGSVAWFDEYDPSTGIWTTLQDAPRARDHFQAVVKNDKLYLIGGALTSFPDKTLIKEVDVFDFSTGTWSTMDSTLDIPTPRDGAMIIPYNLLLQGKMDHRNHKKIWNIMVPIIL